MLISVDTVGRLLEVGVRSGDDELIVSTPYPPDPSS
jgi:hypothetical protein